MKYYRACPGLIKCGECKNYWHEKLRQADENLCELLRDDMDSHDREDIQFEIYSWNELDSLPDIFLNKIEKECRTK